MPIRINLLAEQQAAEEARRRDPVKRALWAGGAAVSLMILWIISLELRITSAKAELSRYDSKLQKVEEGSTEARTRWATNGKLDSQLANLRNYSTNRFFCANLLDALQQVMVDDVRVVQFQTAHNYSSSPAVSYKTNLVFPIVRPSSWQFWKARSPQTNLLSLIASQVALITNQVTSLRTSLALAQKIEFTTNREAITAKVELSKPAAAAEQIVLTIKARDYGNPLGKRVDEFSKAIATHPYFAQRLLPGEGEGIRLRERAIQPESDQFDPSGRAFIPFVIECRFRETVRANE
jgi:hypothetical protein